MQAVPPVPPMSDLIAFSYVALGVLLSLVIPILRKLAFPEPAGGKDIVPPWLTRLLTIAKPYLILGALSLALSLVTLAIAKSQGAILHYWYEPFLMGYFFDSTIQKFKG